MRAAAARPRVEEEAAAGRLLADCGIDLAAVAARCAAARVSLGQSPTRWAAPCLLAAIQVAVQVRRWPAHLVEHALLAVAADPATRSPMRLAEAGPWWDLATPGVADPVDLADLEARLDDRNGWRSRLQAEARAELSAEGLPLTRVTVARRACEILDRRVAG